MTRWDLACRLARALEQGLPRGCAVTMKVPGEAHPGSALAPLKIVAEVEYQDAAGAWHMRRAGARIERLEADPDGVIRELVTTTCEHVLRARRTRP